jgi:nucleotide-binding universal stress UspA family protein
MRYKTILVHVDDTPQAAATIALAARLALGFDAHLLGVATTGVSRYFYRDAAADLARTVLAPYIDERLRAAEALLDRFEALATRTGVRSFERRLIGDETGAALALATRYVDLAVLGQPDPAQPSASGGADLPAYTLLGGARPVLVVPYIQADAGAGRRILVAWNGSTQAARAVSAALPLLRAAEAVMVAVIGTSAEPAQADDALLAWLAQHDVDAELVADSTSLDVGGCLLSLAADRGSDLLVMGAYGHARLRELVMGGATRTVLDTMTIPVLMAH